MPPNETYESDARGSSPCSPLVMPSPSFSGDLLDFFNQQNNPHLSEYSTSRSLRSPLERPCLSTPSHSEADASLPPIPHPEGPALSVLFQSGSSAFADVSPSLEDSQGGLGRSNNRPLSDKPDLSFESIVCNLADEVLSLSKIHSSPIESPKEPALREALEQELSALGDAGDAVGLRQCVVLTEMGYHLNEVAARLRLYNNDTAILTSIADKIKQVEAVAQSQHISIASTATRRHSFISRRKPPFLQRNMFLLLHLQPILDSTKTLRQKAAAFVVDQASFPWMQLRPQSNTC
ncbi:hypothetical protein HYPSUDRAFT_60221 [Hypholoma sublateritium FD-334 SS-4]|uniref:Uncharacterized protein n=1 Tax=Hypholoma sublateritium (strain FD-334 SS-4) TaxID=945553 RepID=A0A0D2LPU1_HYPSF|nr:hypothetical protein HYPSUDRAFT_60221 [Hypholoma sublateritium FD-334 SS-4]